jgi:hypothetical protein
VDGPRYRISHRAPEKSGTALAIPTRERERQEATIILSYLAQNCSRREWRRCDKHGLTISVYGSSS